jgi:hypothetical protein
LIYPDPVLSTLAYRTLSRQDIDSPAVRLFMHLVAEYDLTTFRSLSPTLISQSIGMYDVTVTEHLNNLVTAGLLELGPASKRSPDGLRRPTYRLRPAMLMVPSDLEKLFWGQRAARERESAAPAKQPLSPRPA